MATTYYVKINIESRGTSYTDKDGTSPSKAGHMWYETYSKDDNEKIGQYQASGYTAEGIVNNDKEAYVGDSAYSSKEIAISQTQFDTLEKFGKLNSALAAQHGFGPGHILNGGDYNPATNSCIDYTWKALELAGINKAGFQGDLKPIENRDDIEAIFNGTYLNKYSDWLKATPQDRATFINSGGVPWNYVSSSAIVIVRRDPLVLDLNHDGIVNSISLASSKTFFDMNNDGMSELTSWISADDGMVVYDKNSDGKIDSNNEMFGKTGLDGLTELKNIADSNKDSVFDKNDTLFGTLRVWQDKNQVA